jgi:TniQ
MQWHLWQDGSYGAMGNQYCPACLGEKGHHQLPWSVSIYTCCLRHSCFLRENCPHCGKSFRSASRFLNSSLVDPGKDLRRCAYCNRSVANSAPSERADKRTLRLCHVLGSLVRTSSCESFFDVLARLLYVMCRPSTLAENLRSQMLPGSHQITSRHSSGAPMNFEYLDVKSRAYMLQAVVSLFADWPNYLIGTLRSTNPLHYHLHLFKDLPSWYERAERVAMIPNSKPNPSERDKLLHVATRQGWITAVQFAEETRKTSDFFHAGPV